MKQILLVGSSLVAILLLSTTSWGQGSAIGGVLNTADKLQQEVQTSQAVVTAGPADKQERVAPGKIDPDAPRSFTKTDSGLQYRIL